MNFWSTLSQPIFALAPMEDVTDTVFRALIASISNPECLHVMFTEFVSTDGLCHEHGQDRVIHRLFIGDEERQLLRQLKIPVVAQVWGTKPEHYWRACRMIRDEMDFDGIDINMGCPVPKIVKKGACSALIKTPQLAQEIVRATIEAAAPLPVSVKSRIGIDTPVTEAWTTALLDAEPAAICLHGRLQVMQSTGRADWGEIKKAVAARDAHRHHCPILGNGDVLGLEDGHKRVAETGVDGVMIGRGIFHNPWLFNHEPPPYDPETRLRLLWRHTRRFTETWGSRKNFAILRRFFKIYASNFPDSVQLRVRLMETRSADEVREILEAFRPGITDQGQD